MQPQLGGTASRYENTLNEQAHWTQRLRTLHCLVLDTESLTQMDIMYKIWRCRYMQCYVLNSTRDSKIIKDVPLCHAGTKGERRYSSYSFLTLALDGVSGQRHTPVTLYLPLEKDSWYPFDRGLGEPQSWSEHRGQRKNLFPLPGIEPQSSSL
jgi:hypothetical protein